MPAVALSEYAAACTCFVGADHVGDVAAEKGDVKQRRSCRKRNRNPASVAFLVPCYNKECVIAKIVADFRAVLPEATAYVYDNNSTDGPGEAAWRGG